MCRSSLYNTVAFPGSLMTCFTWILMLRSLPDGVPLGTFSPSLFKQEKPCFLLQAARSLGIAWFFSPLSPPSSKYFICLVFLNHGHICINNTMISLLCFFPPPVSCPEYQIHIRILGLPPMWMLQFFLSMGAGQAWFHLFSLQHHKAIQRCSLQAKNTFKAW